MHRPLADEIRPLELDDVVGQKHILGPGGLLRRVIDSGNIPNMVFYGPSGTGKTTVANIIARKTDRTLRRLNATNASLADIKSIIAELDTMLAPGGVLLYLDEIQYFNKKQQQSLLEFIEDGRITLIASTTENPYFYVYNALLSRSTVFEFKSVPPAEVVPAVRRAVDIISQREGIEAVVEPGAAEYIAQSCGGDVRKAMNSVELLFSAAPRKDGVVNITLQDAKDATQSSAMRYDREGDEHFDSVSALMKSLRGSDPDAALHYLARTLGLPAAAVFGLGGHRAGVSAGGDDSQGLRGLGAAVGPAGGAAAAGGGGAAAGHGAEVELRCRGHRPGDDGHPRGQGRADTAGAAERPRRRHGL